MRPPEEHGCLQSYLRMNSKSPRVVVALRKCEIFFFYTLSAVMYLHTPASIPISILSQGYLCNRKPCGRSGPAHGNVQVRSPFHPLPDTTLLIGFEMP